MSRYDMLQHLLRTQISVRCIISNDGNVKKEKRTKERVLYRLGVRLNCEFGKTVSKNNKSHCIWPVFCFIVLTTYVSSCCGVLPIDKNYNQVIHITKCDEFSPVFCPVRNFCLIIILFLVSFFTYFIGRILE